MASFIADLAECIIPCGAEVEIVRALPSPIEKGRRVGRPEQRRFVATLSVQPMSDKEIRQLPEGMRKAGIVRVFSDCELLTVDTSTCQLPDRFECDGTEYQIQSAADWSGTAGFWNCTATRLGQ